MKKPPQSYGFQERLDFSNGHAPDPDSILPFLKSRIPNFRRVRKAAAVNDRAGCDYYIERHSLLSLGIDLKLRSEDFSIKPPNFADDLALETFSVIEKNIAGWTRDATKSADYILWFWKDTGRFFIVPFPPLCCVFQRYWKPWREQYGAVRQHSTGRSCWHSECVFVPRTVVVDTVGRWCSGHTSKEKTA
jgi:hypothetical protein